MPLLRFDLIAGRSPSQLASMLDAAHLALVQAFKVPVRDRYQIVHEHTAPHLVALDTGLGITRTDKLVVI